MNRKTAKMIRYESVLEAMLDGCYEDAHEMIQRGHDVKFLNISDFFQTQWIIKLKDFKISINKLIFIVKFLLELKINPNTDFYLEQTKFENICVHDNPLVLCFKFPISVDLLDDLLFDSPFQKLSDSAKTNFDFFQIHAKTLYHNKSHLTDKDYDFFEDYINSSDNDIVDIILYYHPIEQIYVVTLKIKGTTDYFDVYSDFFDQKEIHDFLVIILKHINIKTIKNYPMLCNF